MYVLNSPKAGTTQEAYVGTIELYDNKYYLLSKRYMDIVLSIIGLLLLIPVFVIVAALIKLEDPEAPVFFKQVRVGKDGKTFNMYKFRSMIHHAESLIDSLLDQNESSGALFKMKEDPRVTKIGRFIRKTSIDELPQLWNVLKGEMSLVGPRPPLPREVETYTEYHKQRLSVVPGCTGLWQVSGRSSVGFEKMVELDLHYIQNRHFFYDVKLICKTIIIIFYPNNAY
ncbi:sugar transferase [Pradoshia sp.]|uniref:sugar transferase n=1 Tax=Bacillaceae TaxID=186817 RepID=UPI003F10623F